MAYESPIAQRARELLIHRDRTITYETIAKETGLTVRFLQTFVYKQSEDFGVNRVTKLYEYLSGKKLEVA